MTGTNSQFGLLSTKNSVELQSFPIPVPGPKEVLIKNVAVASNPKDWKYPIWIADYAAIEGNDVAGYIESVGEGVTEFKKGDRVAAFSKMATQENKYGAYQEYTVAPSTTTFPLGPNTSFEDASTLPLAAMTAAIGQFVRLGLPQPPESGFASARDDYATIINGAATNVGAFAVQLAKRAGLHVIGVAGSTSYAKSMGVDELVNYKEENNLESALVKAAKSREVSYAYDCVSENGSILLLARVLSKTSADGKGKVNHILHLADGESKQIPNGIEPVLTWVDTAYGEYVEFAAKYYRLLGRWLDEGSFKPSRVRLVPGGLAGVGEALKELQEGKVHGEKLVYRIAETPQIKARDGK
ncbi:GroES-like protein [Rickenella mellea]|uniref:GroES-like protein n=1 Tax=Rickenella mellea TaxID=50990 RepID=A0A4Y7QET3_9AGAM|nr:GroES-like protein [Rickenella mellea]